MSHPTTTSEGAWMLPLVTNQTLAHAVLLFVGLLISFIAWNLFLSIDGASIQNVLFWITSLLIWTGPQFGLYSEWKVKIETQYTAEIVILGIRTGVWIPEGIYIVPFYKLLIEFNATEIQHTSHTDISVTDIPIYDKNGEELIFSATAEKEIEDHSVYASFDEHTMSTNEQEIVISAIGRALTRKKYWTEIMGKEKELGIEDDIFKQKCTKFGLKISEIVLVVRVKDTSAQSLNAKRAKIAEDLISETKSATGKTILTSEELSDINDRVEVIINKAQKQIIKGVKPNNINYWAGSNPAPKN